MFPRLVILREIKSKFLNALDILFYKNIFN